MVKALIFQTFRFCLVLAIGQIPMGHSTVGAQFISGVGKLSEKSAGKKSVERVSSFFESLRQNASSESLREVTSKQHFKFDKLKTLIPKENIGEDESEELTKVLEKE